MVREELPPTIHEPQKVEEFEKKFPILKDPFLVSGICNVSIAPNNLKRRRHSQTEACPCCSEDEDHNHIISCQHTLMSQTFDELYSEVQTLLNQSAAPGIENDICLLLHIFCDPTTVPTNTEELGSSIHGQLQLGQGAFFAGLWTHDWIQRQEIFHQQLRTPRAAQRWIVSLIQKIQQIPKAMWKIRNQILHNNRDTHKA